MDKLSELKKTCESCHKCALAEKRTNVVFGAGVPEARIMLIGEGPGREEDERGEAFVGASGRLLDLLLSYFGLSRKKNIFIGNIVKCRPEGNRDPTDDEQNACIPYLLEQIRLIDPAIIICLGRISAKKFIAPDFKITADHGRFYERDGRLVTATFHPSALLRDPAKKTDAFSDFKNIEQKLKELGI